MMRSLWALLASLPAVAFAADPTGPEILAKVDAQLNSFKDGVFESKLVLKQSDGSAREYVFTTYQKVPDKRLVRFSSPGDVKGMGVLVENAETMYVFLPGFQRIRRMGTHIKNQTFMGSDFSFEDMSQTRFGGIYEATLAGQDDKTYTLDLRAKKAFDLEFPKIRMWVDKGFFAPVKMEFQDAAGKKLKTQVRENYKNDHGQHWQPGRIKVTDHRRNDHSSEIVFTGTRIDSGLPDDLFTQRSLIRGQ